MQISLRVRLDGARDRLCVELEPGAVGVQELKLTKKPEAPKKGEKAEKPAEAMTLQLDASGYLVAVEIPGLAAFLKEFTGADEVGDVQAKG